MYYFLDCHTYSAIKFFTSLIEKKMSFGTKDITQCWENYVGFAFYRLIIVDFAFLLVSTFFGEFVRRCELLIIVVIITFKLALTLFWTISVREIAVCDHSNETYPLLIDRPF